MFLRFEELVLGTLLFSNINFRISMDSWAWLHLLERSLNYSWSEVTRWRKMLMSASCFSLVILARMSILASKIFWWARIFSNSACKSTQWRQSSFLAIEETRTMTLMLCRRRALRCYRSGEFKRKELEGWVGDNREWDWREERGAKERESERCQGKWEMRKWGEKSFKKARACERLSVMDEMNTRKVRGKSQGRSRGGSWGEIGLERW